MQNESPETFNFAYPSRRLTCAKRKCKASEMQKKSRDFQFCISEPPPNLRENDNKGRESCNNGEKVIHLRYDNIEKFNPNPKEP